MARVGAEAIVQGNLVGGRGLGKDLLGRCDRKTVRLAEAHLVLHIREIVQVMSLNNISIANAHDSHCELLQSRSKRLLKLVMCLV